MMACLKNVYLHRLLMYIYLEAGILHVLLLLLHSQQGQCQHKLYSNACVHAYMYVSVFSNNKQPYITSASSIKASEDLLTIRNGQRSLQKCVSFYNQLTFLWHHQYPSVWTKKVLCLQKRYKYHRFRLAICYPYTKMMVFAM